jgi:hypothetical protein
MNRFINDYEIVKIELHNYSNNGNLAIELLCVDKEYRTLETFDFITTNLECILKANEGYIRNDNINIIKFIENNKLGVKIPNRTMQSGFCKYDLYEFDLKAIEQYNLVNNK